MTKPAESTSRFPSLRDLLTPPKRTRGEERQHELDSRSLSLGFLRGKGFARAVRAGVAVAALTAAACSSQARVENRHGGDQPDAGITQPTLPDASTAIPTEDGSSGGGSDGGGGGEPPPPPLDTDEDGIPNSEEYRGCETLADDGTGTHNDDDGDGWCNARDNSPAYNPSQADGDLDGVGDATDNDLDHANALQVDVDEDGHGTPGDCDDNDDTVPGAEVCDGEDNDCDEVVDPDCECQPIGSTRSVGVATAPCVAATETCTASGSGSIWETTSPATGPTLEVCDGADNDCDAAVDEILASCDCVPGLSAPRACGSDVGECEAGTQECRADGTWGECVGQQGPTDESCDGLDNNCNGDADEDYDAGDPCTGTGACGIGPEGEGVRECVPDHTRTQCSVNRGGSHDRSLGEELANERDDDCDGLVDEDHFSVVGGAAGETARMGEACHRGAESGPCRTNGVYVTAGDRAVRCNAEDPGSPLNPADDEDGQDLCDGVDNDCDGVADDGCPGPEGETRSCSTGTDEGACVRGTQTRGADGLFGACEGAVGPVAEVCGDGLDNNCDGQTDNFPLGTRGAACQAGVGACSGPGGMFECLADGSGVRCDTDVGGSRSRATAEICDVSASGVPVDNDCDGLANEGSWEREDGATTSIFGLDCNPPGDVCGPGHMVCVTSSTVACSSWLTRPVTGDSEVGNCDGRDNNCDGSTDEGCGGCDEGETRVCGDPDGECREGTQTCNASGEWGAACVGSVTSAPERCDGLDNDCNGAVDNGFPVGVACDGVGQCGGGTLICNDAHDGVVCSTDAGEVDDDSVSEVCDGLDQDCDRVSDDGLRDRADRDLGLPGVVCPLPGECRLETVRCESSGSLFTECTTSGRGGVVTERCDEKDNDCDSATDEAFADKGAACSVTCPDASTVSGIRVCAASELATVCSATLVDCP